jgi:uncharacterized membrane protein YesL
MNRLWEPLRVIKQAFIDWWDALVSLILLNLVWALCWLTVILGPPATFVLYYAANELAHGHGYDYKDLVQVGRKYFVVSWLWALLNVLVLSILGVNAVFYSASMDLGHIVLLELAIFMIALWLIVQFYAIPYFMEQHDQRLQVAFRNSFFTIFKSPLFTLVISLFAGFVMATSLITIVLMFLGGPCLIAILGNRAVLNRLEAFGVRKPDVTVEDGQ